MNWGDTAMRRSSVAANNPTIWSSAPREIPSDPGDVRKSPSADADPAEAKLGSRRAQMRGFGAER